MIKQLTSVILDGPGAATGTFQIKIGQLSILTGKKIKSIFTKKHFSSQANVSPANEPLVSNDLFANCFLNLRNKRNENIIDGLPISAINNAIEQSGRYDQLDVSEVDFEKSSLTIVQDSNLSTQVGKKIQLFISYE